MERERTIRKGIKILTREDKVKFLLYDNFTDIDETNYLKKHKISAVSINDNFNEENLQRILSTKFLTALDCDFSNFSPSSFYQLKELLYLNLVDSKMPRGFVFKKLENLEQLELNWDKTYDFSNCKNLKDLVLRKTHAENLKEINNLPQLERLELIQGKLKGLDGIENYNKLKAFTMYSLRKINSLDNLLELKDLIYLDIRNYHNEIDLEKISGTEKAKMVSF